MKRISSLIAVACLSMSCPLFALDPLVESSVEYINADQALRNSVIGQPQVTVEGEIRTVDGTQQPRMWGKGRPTAKRYGTNGVELDLCTRDGIAYGLSYAMVDWGSAEDACPAGTWVCSEAELMSGAPPYGPCDTARPDSPVDFITCAGGGIDQQADDHYGWLADSDETAIIGLGMYHSELNVSGSGSAAYPCSAMPVWCCSEAPPP